jgi:hypothetical protein
MKRTTLIAAALTVLGAALLFAIPASSSQSWKGGYDTATVDQDAASNIGQNAKVFVTGWSPFADVDQTAASNIGQNAKVEAKHGKATVDQRAYANIEQNANVVSKSPFHDRDDKDRHDRRYDGGYTDRSDEPRYGVCVIRVDSPCNAERWE